MRRRHFEGTEPYLRQHVAIKENFVKPLNWVQFEWDLTALPDGEASLPEHYRIARASADDETGLRKLFSSAFLLDPSWNPAIAQTMEAVQPWLDDAFTSETKICLALRHGARI